MIRKSSTVEIGLSGLNGALVPLPTLKASTKVFIAELAFCLRKLLDGGQPVWLVPQSLAPTGGASSFLSWSGGGVSTDFKDLAMALRSPNLPI